MVYQLTNAIVQMLREDSVLASMLGVWPDTNGVNQPAIFTTAPYPEGAAPQEIGPIIITESDVSEVPMDTKTTMGSSIVRDIRCYTAETDDATIVDQIAVRVKDIFHRQERVLNQYLTDFTAVKCWHKSTLTGPHLVDEYVYARIVSLSIWLSRNQYSNI